MGRANKSSKRCRMGRNPTLIFLLSDRADCSGESRDRTPIIPPSSDLSPFLPGQLVAKKEKKISLGQKKGIRTWARTVISFVHRNPCSVSYELLCAISFRRPPSAHLRKVVSLCGRKLQVSPSVQVHPHCQGARYHESGSKTSFACCRNCIEEERSSPGQDDGGDDVADDPQDGEGRLGHALHPEGELRIKQKNKYI